MSNDDGNKSFWTTLPGILTGIAAVLTAVAGLLAVIDLPNDDVEHEQNTALLVPNTTETSKEAPTDEPLKIDSFGLDYTTILQGDSSNLSWSVSGARKVNLLPLKIQVEPKGFLVVSPEKTTDYSLTAMNGTEQVVALANLEVISLYSYAKGNKTFIVSSAASGGTLDLDINSADFGNTNLNYSPDLSFGGNFEAPFTPDVDIVPFYGAVIEWGGGESPLFPLNKTKVPPDTSIKINNWPEEKCIWTFTDKGGISKVSINDTVDKWTGTVNISYMTWPHFTAASGSLDS